MALSWSMESIAIFCRQGGFSDVEMDSESITKVSNGSILLEHGVNSRFLSWSWFFRCWNGQ